ncbi:MAG: hypothetical protein U0798_09115 [Gemmataceae bacterium]
MPESSPCKPPLLVFSDDWGRHPSSCQHLIGKLLPTRNVVWVNTIGTRPPRFDWQTAKRIVEKARQWSGIGGNRREKAANAQSVPGGLSSQPSNPRIVSPKMWPSFKSRFGRSLNKSLLLRSLTPVIESLPSPPIVVTTLPLVADLIGKLNVKRWVYYCVDDFGEWPGYDGATMRTLERDLVPKVDEIVAVSDTLVNHLKELGRESHLLTHGVDLDHWRVPQADNAEEFANIEGPYTVFWGVIDRRMDIDFVKHLAENLTKGTIVLFGPQDNPDPLLFQLPRVVVKSAVPFSRLPAIAASASVLIMPYADLPVTRAIQPLKLKEYLATGKPAVVRALPSTRGWNSACDVCETKETFTQAVNDRLRKGILVSQRTEREQLDAESWAGKARLFEGWIDGVPT